MDETILLTSSACFGRHTQQHSEEHFPLHPKEEEGFVGTSFFLKRELLMNDFPEHQHRQMLGNCWPTHCQCDER